MISIIDMQIMVVQISTGFWALINLVARRLRTQNPSMTFVLFKKYE